MFYCKKIDEKVAEGYIIFENKVNFLNSIKFHEIYNKKEA
jgi:hypothetical protein